MGTLHATETVTVWLDDEGHPTGLLWRDRRFTVTDKPTIWVMGLQIGGWRFQGTHADGESHVFDVRHDDGRQEWELVTIYD